MDPNFPKCTFLAFHSIGLYASSLIFVALLIIEISPVIIERGMRSGLLNKGSSSRDAIWSIIGRRSVSYFNEYTETHLSAISTPEARASLIKHEAIESVSPPFSRIE